MEKQSRMHLFQGYGIELEYMIVDKDTLDVKPIADELLRDAAGIYVDEYVNGSVTWSNELVLHVVELKCTQPTNDLVQLNKDFQANVEKINHLLKKYNARLMPTAAHPWMNPHKETFLWPHGNSEVYETYNRIFNCQGHGWSNLQSTHINLPFYDDEEFAKLHAAARLLLPLIPALAASSPIINKEFTGVLDKRLIYYQNNQRKISSIVGKVIPERVYSKRQYRKQIYERIEKDIRPYDTVGVLNPIWVNSRGIIARFDRGSIEIRLIDIQECPKADLAIASLIIHAIKVLVNEVTSSYHIQQSWSSSTLYDILQKTIKEGPSALIDNTEYLNTLGMDTENATAGNIWRHLFALTVKHFPEAMKHWAAPLEIIVNKGPLAQRILDVANKVYTHNNLKLIYQELSDNLSENQLFEKCDHSILS